MSTGDGPVIRLVDEPITFHHAATAGDAHPGAVQPAPGQFGLEEEPAVWPDLGERSATPSGPPTLSGPSSSLPNTAPAPALLALPQSFASAALAGGVWFAVWVLRRRLQRSTRQGDPEQTGTKDQEGR